MLFYFPQDFLWGSSISAYQTEGGNFNSDWSLWEKKHGLQEAGFSTNHYHTFPEDFSLARYLGHNALRFSIEWARIFPQRGCVDQEQLNHYIEVISELKRNGIMPLVCLHHFTNPLWFNRRGGWILSSSVDDFCCYVDTVLRAVGKEVKYWITFNEPLVYIYQGFLVGRWPPGRKSWLAAGRVLKNILKAHSICYRLIKNFYGTDEVSVSVTKHLSFFCPCPFGIEVRNRFYSSMRDKVFNRAVLDYLVNKRLIDFIGVNYYYQEFIKGGGWLIFGDRCDSSHHSGKRNTMGWFIYPQGLYKMLVGIKKYSLPLIITENGTADKDDADYEIFLKEHIRAVARAIKTGVDVRGYLWWSLLDNFEWDRGFGPRFGLIEVDYRSLARRVKPFALVYKGICRRNAVDI